MNDKFSCDIDSSQIDRFLNALANPEQRNKIISDGLKEGAKVLQKNTVKNLQGQPFETSNLKKGVKIKNDKAYLTSKVHIMGDFRLKFFEMGTKERMTKGRKIVGKERRNLVREGQGHSTGRIKPHYFFKAARDNEGEIIEAIAKSIDNAIKNLQQ